MTPLGTETNPLRVAIIGSGPSGFYAAEALLKALPITTIDMFERLASPFGLVRSGVAPDHPKLKEPIRIYQQIAEAQRFRFFGNVTVGQDVSLSELKNCYQAVIFACGAKTDRRLEISGEDLIGSHAATEFVGWYNGHPDYRDLVFDLSHEVAVVIGQGNVAVDVCRILCKTPEELKHTDIAAHAFEILAQSKIRDVYMIGRRGPVQAKFTHQELRELGELADCDPVVKSDDLKLNPASEIEFKDKRSKFNISKSFEILQSFSTRGAPSRHRRCHIQFLRSPKELRGQGRLEKVLLAQNRLEGQAFNQVAVETGVTVELKCGVLFRSIGYCGTAIPGVPFDNHRKIFPSKDGRIVDGNGNVLPGLYVTGWIKRGPIGVIGTNRADSVATVTSLLADLTTLSSTTKSGAEGLIESLVTQGVRIVTYADWQKIDRVEVTRGVEAGKPREKFTRSNEMFEVLNNCK